MQFKLPSLGSNVPSADVARILVKEGDVIAAETNVFELETEKAVMELACPHAGRITKILVKQGQTLKSGDPLLEIDAVGAATPASAPAPAAPAPVAAPAKPATSPAPANSAPSTTASAAAGPARLLEFRLPSLGSNVPSADVAKMLVKVGDVIAAETNVLELETEKAVMELACPHAGRITSIAVKPGQKLVSNDLILTVESVAAGAVSASAPPAPVPAAAQAPTVAASAPSTAVATAPARTATAPMAAPLSNGHGKPIPAGPSTRRMARKLGVDLRQVSGTGPAGRITMDDLEGFVKSAMAGGGTAPASGPAELPLPDFASFGEFERKPLSKIAKTAAANLSHAWRTIPHVTQQDLADITELEAKRKQFVAAAGDKSPKVTMTVLAMKAVVTCLKEFPIFNASFDGKAGELVLKKYFHLGIAVDTENGLVVPVIRDVDKKSIRELAAELTGVAKKARDRKLTMDDFQGGCFTISNLGGVGGTAFTPIVNWPEVAILGMSRSRQEYVMHQGKPEFRLMLPLSLSYDHRAINGADAARFISRLSSILSDPFGLLVDM
jgi:pyruvate dehydrogenase E2 component (dihydrolipoamide acetyltransferase)